eukprot:m51a1_g4775 hypothetical protein (280) ;mRNA; r:28828-30041
MEGLWRTAYELVEETKPCVITMCADLDRALGGGVRVGEMTQFYGVPGIGKTQLGLQLAACAHIPARFGGVAGQALYIDTEGAFTARRLEQIARGLVDHMQRQSQQQQQQQNEGGEVPSVEDVMQGTHVLRPRGHRELLGVVHALPVMLQRLPRVRLVVLDSLAFAVQHEIEDTGLRVRLLATIGQLLLRVAQEHNLAVVVMNQMTTRVSGDTAQLVLSLGEAVAHCSSSLVLLYWKDDFSATARAARQRLALVEKSPCSAPAAVPFAVLPVGVRSARST